MWRRETDLHSGYGAVSLKDDILLIDDSGQGLAVYRLSTGHRIKTMTVKIESAQIEQNVVVHDQGSAVVIGSDHGCVYVFDRRTGDVRDVLPAGTDWVQSVAVSTERSKRRKCSRSRRWTRILEISSSWPARVLMSRKRKCKSGPGEWAALEPRRTKSLSTQAKTARSSGCL